MGTVNGRVVLAGADDVSSERVVVSGLFGDNDRCSVLCDAGMNLVADF